MSEYPHNKLRTSREIVRRIENWPTALGLRLFRKRAGLRLLSFRNGLNVVCRGATRDWDVVHELFFAGSYGRAMQFLRLQPDSPVVLDLGGNIGLFSLLAASSHDGARITAFEPGPPNQRLFEINRLANSELSDRIELKRAAVGGTPRRTEWFFDDQNPGGSGLYAVEGRKYPVEVMSFANVIAALGRVTLAKIDIEGAEYEILKQTPPEIWDSIQSISLELHGDPDGTMTQEQFLDHLKGVGFSVEPESVCSYFLTRQANGA